jgi:hypothetical protein
MSNQNNHLTILNKHLKGNSQSSLSKTQECHRKEAQEENQ